LTYGVIVPERNVHLVCDLHGLLPHRLTQAQCHSGGDIGDIFAQDEHRIREFDFVQRRGMRGTTSEDLDHGRNQPELIVGHAGVEALASN
jgi:hypothetical protein